TMSSDRPSGRSHHQSADASACRPGGSGTWTPGHRPRIATARSGPAGMDTGRMVQLRVALAQIDVTVGDLSGNSESVVAWCKEAAARGAHLAAFRELALTGYPPEDLVFRESFRDASVAALHELAGRLAAAGLGELAVVVGYLDRDGGPRNAAAVLHGGRVVA